MSSIDLFQFLGRPSYADGSTLALLLYQLNLQMSFILLHNRQKILVIREARFAMLFLTTPIVIDAKSSSNNLIGFNVLYANINRI